MKLVPESPAAAADIDGSSPGCAKTASLLRAHVGSVIDGEDVLQDALIKAWSRLHRRAVGNPEGWLFRIAHNTALISCAAATASKRFDRPRR